MNEQRLKGLMGLSVRARQAVFGEDGCLKCVRGGHCVILLLDQDASPATQSKYRSACERTGTPLLLLRPGLLLEATGRPGMAMAVVQGGLGSELVKAAETKSEE